MQRIIIVGGVAGGASAAARLRRLDETAEIILFEKGPHISYANCGLPYYIGNVITDEDELLLQTPESFHARFQVDVRVRQEVVSIDINKRTVRVRRADDGGEYEERYDQLLLSPGAEPFVPPVRGIELERVFRLRSVGDAARIRRAVDTGRYRRAVVIGGGFIGLEVAENLTGRGVSVTVVEAAPQILAPYDEEMARILQKRMEEEEGVRFLLNAQATGIEQSGDDYAVLLPDSSRILCDFVVFAIGVRPDTRLARDAGLALNARGGIVTDEWLATSDKHVYAAGDAIELHSAVNNQRTMIPLAGPANRQGRIAAGNLLGLSQRYAGALGSSVIKVFDRTAACTGLNERALKLAAIPYEKAYLLPYSHATYYPNAEQMVLKLLFSPGDRRVLGAQCIGGDGVEKRVDVIATAMHFHATVDDLAALDLCYAPPYSSAKDPVNMAGYVAQNLLDGLSHLKHADALAALDPAQTVLVDVRTEEEYAEGHLPGSVNIPLDALRARLRELPRDKELLLYCQVGLRGYVAQRILMQKGFERVYNLSGGYALQMLIS